MSGLDEQIEEIDRDQLPDGIRDLMLCKVFDLKRTKNELIKKYKLGEIKKTDEFHQPFGESHYQIGSEDRENMGYYRKEYLKTIADDIGFTNQYLTVKGEGIADTLLVLEMSNGWWGILAGFIPPNVR